MNGVFALGGKIFDILARWTLGKINNDQAADELEAAAKEAIVELRGLRAEIAADRKDVDAVIDGLPRKQPAPGAPASAPGGTP